MIELQEDDDSAIEYVDMELEQPIEIESTSNISPETMTPTTSSSSIISSSSSLPSSSATSKPSVILLPASSTPEKKKSEQATKVDAVTAPRITVTASTLP